MSEIKEDFKNLDTQEVRYSYDEKNNVNRALRYAVNQKSPFEDEQDGNAILEPIVFEDGFLSVPKTNPVLQQFLHYHPFNGIIFVEVDKEREASDEVNDLNLEVDALVEARQLKVDQIEILSRVLFGKDPTMVTTAELKRDLLNQKLAKASNLKEALDYLLKSEELEQIKQYEKWTKEFLQTHPISNDTTLLEEPIIY